MSVYVDEAIDYDTRIGKAGPWWCHLTADTPDELHAFAQRLGLRREWCSDRTQPGAHPLHYDLACNPWNRTNLRVKAIRLGAREVSATEQARQRLATKGVAL